MNPGQQHQHDIKHTYSGVYPDGSLIKTELCHGCGIIVLTIRRAREVAESQFVINQIQANEIAYALLKGNNRFMHLIEEAVQSSPPVAPGDDTPPPAPVRVGV